MKGQKYMSYRPWIPCLMITAAFAFSCSKEKQAKAPEQTMSPASAYEQEANEPGAATANAAAAPQTIAEARCDREERCNNIGGDKKYSTKTLCVETVKSDWQNDLSARECPKGVKDVELAQCVEAIRNEDCNSPFDTLDRVVECQVSDICVD